MAGGLLTKWTVAEIQYAIVKDILGGGKDAIAIPNVSFGFFKDIECDLIAITKSGYLHEYEIKRSKEDFLADFRKPQFHNDVRIKKLTYALPEEMAGEWLKKFCEENYKSFRREFDFLFYSDRGMMCRFIDTNTSIEKYLTAWYLTTDMIYQINLKDRDHLYRRKVFLEEQNKLLRLLNFRYWNRESRDIRKRNKVNGDVETLLPFMDDLLENGKSKE